jgi:hypothetical protein
LLTVVNKLLLVVASTEDASDEGDAQETEALPTDATGDAEDDCKRQREKKQMKLIQC